jgi:putative ABC transport system permease protein
MLMKNPGVSAVAILTLALGIGANAAIFSVVNTVLLRPLPYNEPERLLALWENVPAHGQWRASPANFLDWKNQNTTFAGMAAYGGSSMTLTGEGEPERLLGARVSSGYFEVLGVSPALGRAFLSEEYEPGKGQVVILDHSLWQRRYGADRNIIKKSITLDGSSFQVVGVMPPGLYPVRPTTSGRISFDDQEQQYWLPMSFTAEWASVRGAHVLGVIGRLKAGVTLEQASAEMNTIAARLEQEHEANRGEGIIVSPFMKEVVGDVRQALFTLLAAVGMVLLIACANIAALLLAQHAARSKEIAIRVALGARRRRLVTQFFTEGLMLSTIGAVVGIGLAVVGMSTLLKFIPPGIPRLGQTGLDWTVLSFTLILSVATCFVFTLMPALQASNPNLHATLEQSGRRSGPSAQFPWLLVRKFLVVFQISIAVILVVSAGLLIKSFWLMKQVDPGFRPERVLSLNVTLPRSKYSDPAKINQFFNQLNDGISNLPGVESAAIAYDHPLQANWVDSFEIEGHVPTPGETSLSANFNSIGPEYFQTVGTQLITGRHFTSLDDPDHPGVVIVNEAFVKHYFPNEMPLGRRIRPAPPARIWDNERLTSFEIVGIVRDVKSSGLQAAGAPTYYLPATQAPLEDMVILVRTSSEPTALFPALRGAVWAVDPNQPISNVSTLEQIVSDSVAKPRFNMFLMGLFGGLALILAVVGIYGLLSYVVSQRTHEMGIRMALGADRKEILKLVLRQGITLAVVGEVLGLAGALAVARLLKGLLFGVGPADSSTFLAVGAGVIIVALLACYVPARRATKVDPLEALRYE